MNSLRAVYLHELQRSLTAGRVAWWFAMAGFPMAITLLLRTNADFSREFPPDQLDPFWSVLLYVFIPCVCCSLSVLLTAAPAIATELEQRSLVYLATRPNGLFWLMLGKYLVAVTWGTTASWASVAGCMMIANTSTPLRIASTLAGLSFLSAVSYSAVYLLIGALVPKRAMVFSVMYTGLVEVVLGFIPAIVNRMTVQYRLRSLLVQWLPDNTRMREMPAFSYVFADGSSIVQCLWLMGLTAVFLSAAVFVAHRREFTTASEGDL